MIYIMGMEVGSMPRETELYRLELEMANEVFGDDKFLSISEIAKRTGRYWTTVRKMFADEKIPSVGISKARYAYALSRERRL